MVKPKTELRKVRYFGDLISDALTFIKQEFKPLTKSYILIAGIAILLFAVLFGLTLGKFYGGIFDTATKGGADVLSNYDNFSIPILVTMFIVAIFTSAAIMTVPNVYMKLYMQKQNQSPAFNEVWEGTVKYIGKVLVFHVLFGLCLALVAGMLIAGGMLVSPIVGAVLIALLLIPLIYIGICMTIASQVIIFEEETSFIKIWQRCFYLVKDNFWSSFLVYVLSSIIISFASGAIGLITGALFGGAMYLTTKEIGSSIGTLYSIFYLFTYIFYVYFVITVSLNYFSLVEKKEGTGLLQRIQNIGSSADRGLHNIEERY